MSVYPRRNSELCILRELFWNTEYTRDNSLTLVASPTIATGMTLNGTTQYATKSLNDCILNGKTTLTFEMWFTPTFAASDNTRHYLLDTTAGAGARCIIFKNDDNSIGVYLGNTSLTAITLATYQAYWNVNKPNHLAVCAATGSTLVYLNNNLIGTIATAWSITAQPATLYIGASNSGANLSAGTIHSFSIYSVKWDANEVSDAFNKCTFTEMAFSKAVVHLPCKSQYSPDGGTNYYTENLGTGTDVICGAGALYMPTQAQYNGFVYDGANSYLDCGSDVVGTSAGTFAALIQETGLGEGSTGKIFCNGSFIIGGGGTLTYVVTSDDVTYNNGTSNIRKLGTVNTIIITRTAANPSLSNIYINGVLSGTADQSSGTPTAGATNLIIGNTAARDGTFAGTIKWPTLWTSFVGTPTQVRECHNRLMAMINK